jgi:carbamoyltransferase
MIILGLSLSADTHASLLIDGEIKACVGEERLARIKNYTGFPYRAIEEVLRLESIDPSDIDLVTVGFSDYLNIRTPMDIEILMERGGDIDFSNEKPWWYRKAILASSINGDLKRLFKLADNRESLGSFMREKLNDMNIIAPIKKVDHHTAHALSAYYFSNKRKNLVLTADGYGDGLCGAVYTGIDGALTSISNTPKLHSLGVMYAASTKFLGFKSHKHEGKLTGLAAYGDPDRLYNQLSKIVSYDNKNNTILFNLDVLEYNNSKIINRIKTYYRLFNGSYLPGGLTHPILNYLNKIAKGASKEDVSAATQKVFEEIYLKHVSAMVKKTGLTDLAVAGGNFANVKLNQRLLQETGATSITIHPNMGDGGTAIGSAIYHQLIQDKKDGKEYQPRRLKNVYLGNDIDEKSFLAHIKTGDYHIEEYQDSAKRVAELIADGYILGRISGRMEYGPRALGNRSILAHPFNKDINDDLNKRLTRTEFMPFAPSVQKDKSAKYYDDAKRAEYPGEFMTITLNVKKEGQLAEAVNHVDNTARPHFVDKNNNSDYCDILTEFEKLSGYPIIINTSFNKHEEPIVRTAMDGLERLKDDSVQYLVVGNIIVSKNKFVKNYQDSIPMRK